MYKSTTMSVAETKLLRRIENVVRLGRVKRIERESIVLEQGTVPTRPGRLYVHCTAIGLNPAPDIPIFAPGRITLQPIRTGLIPFNAAVVGYVEATRFPSRATFLAPPTPAVGFNRAIPTAAAYQTDRRSATARRW